MAEEEKPNIGLGLPERSCPTTCVAACILSYMSVTMRYRFVFFFRFESCRKFQHLIEAFNINTNAWVMSYVYKRLK